MPAQRNARHPKGDFTAAFPGRLAKQHKARWLKARDELNGLRVRPSTRLMLRVLIDRVAKRPHLHRVMVGYGGVKDANHRARLESLKARGIVPTPGLAELSGMSRSSMIRAMHQLVGDSPGVLRKVAGRGRGNANAYVLRTGDPEAELPAPMPDPDPVTPNLDAYQRFKAKREELWTQGSRGP